MDQPTVRRLKGIAFLALAVLAGTLVAFVWLEPGAFESMHPVPLVALLVVTLVVTLWQATKLLDGDL